MEKIKKYIWIASTLFLFGTNIGTIVFFTKWYGKKIESNTAAANDNTDAVSKLVNSNVSILQWMKGHDQRHIDHADLHEAERDGQ